MSLSRRAQVLDAVFAALDGIAGVKTHHNPEYELGPTDFPAVAQIDGGDDVLDQDGGSILVGQRVSVVVAAAARTGKLVGETLSDLRAKVRFALAADPSFGGLVRRVVYVGSDDPVMVTEPGVAPYGAMVCGFVVDFTEDEADPYAPG